MAVGGRPVVDVRANRRAFHVALRCCIVLCLVVFLVAVESFKQTLRPTRLRGATGSGSRNSRSLPGAGGRVAGGREGSQSVQLTQTAEGVREHVSQAEGKGQGGGRGSGGSDEEGLEDGGTDEEKAEEEEEEEGEADIGPVDSLTWRNATWQAGVAEWFMAHYPPHSVDVWEPFHTKPCKNSCSGNGVCNGELGQCQCSLGYAGADCSRDDLRECNNRPNPEFPYGVWIVSICSATCDRRQSLCYCGNGTKFPDRPVFEACGFWHDSRRGNEPVYAKPDPDRLFKQAGSSSSQGSSGKRGSSIRGRKASRNSGDADDKTVGWCNADPFDVSSFGQRPLAYCICAYDGAVGLFCEIPTRSYCFGHCSVHGRCDRGYCRCNKGWFGMDCAVPSAPPWGGARHSGDDADVVGNGADGSGGDAGDAPRHMPKHLPDHLALAQMVTFSSSPPVSTSGPVSSSSPRRHVVDERGLRKGREQLAGVRHLLTKSKIEADEEEEGDGEESGSDEDEAEGEDSRPDEEAEGEDSRSDEEEREGEDPRSVEEEGEAGESGSNEEGSDNGAEGHEQDKLQEKVAKQGELHTKVTKQASSHTKLVKQSDSHTKVAKQGYLQTKLVKQGESTVMEEKARGEVKQQQLQQRQRWQQQPEEDSPGGLVVRRQRPLVYVYDLPPEFSSHAFQGRHAKMYCAPWTYDEQNNTDYNDYWLYGMEPVIIESFLASPHRTTNPEEADYFFVPVAGTCLTARTYDSPGFMTQDNRAGFTARKYLGAFHYIQRKLPYWNRTHGRDHIWVFGWDEGSCFAPLPIRNSTLITSWGNTGSKHAQSTTAYTADDWGAVPLLVAASLKRPCFDPAKDVVMPAWKSPRQIVFEERRWERSYKHRRRQLFYFNGNLGADFEGGRPESGYSMGIRQTVARYFGSSKNIRGALGLKHEKGVVVTHEKTLSYGLELASSQFCGVFPGDGFSARMEDSILNGCIPVIIQDGVQMPYENFLNYSSFAVRIPEEKIPKMVQILKSISKRRVRAMLHAVRGVWARWTYLSAMRTETRRQRQWHEGKNAGEWDIAVDSLRGEDDAIDTLWQILLYKLFNDPWREEWHKRRQLQHLSRVPQETA